MSPLSIGSATNIYKTASVCEITRHWLEHTGLADASRSLRTLVQSLDTEAEDEFWQRVLGPIRRLAFALCSTPLPFDRAVTACGVQWDHLHREVRLCRQLFPDSHAPLASVVQKLESLAIETASPFTAVLESLHREYGGMSIVLRNPRMNQAVAGYFAASAGLRKAKVVSARQLRESRLCDVLVAIGPCGWFPDHVFLAPRAPRIHVVSYRWIGDPWKPGPVFLNSAGSANDRSRMHYVGVLPQLKGQATSPMQGIEDLKAVDLLPPLPPFSQAGPHIPGWSRDAGADGETLPARLCHLSGGRAVFVSADERAFSLVIDSSKTGNSIVRRLPVEELEPELYLLLRTSGGGDYIAPLADHLLGDKAVERRAQQAEWKNKLTAEAQRRFGLLGRRELATRVAGHLRAQHLSKARPENIHYWMSTKCIHPLKVEDFAAILSFADMPDRAKELWEAMGEIHRAHKRAGHTIRRMLLQKIATTSLEPLERDGVMEFDLDEQDGGTLSAFQIISVSAEDFEVPAHRIGALLDLEK